MTKHEEYCKVVMLGYSKSFDEWMEENFGKEYFVNGKYIRVK